MQTYMKSAMPFLGVQKPARDELARELFGEPLTFDAWQDTVLDAVAGGDVPRGALHGARARRRPPLPGAPHDGGAAAVRGADRDRRVVGLRRRGGGRDARRAARPRSGAGAGAARAGRPTRTCGGGGRRSSPRSGARQRTDLALLYDCIEPNRGDREFFIRKAIGWALRAYAWVDPDEIVRYCSAHELSGLSRREGCDVKATGRRCGSTTSRRSRGRAPRRRGARCAAIGARIAGMQRLHGRARRARTSWSRT